MKTIIFKAKCKQTLKPLKYTLPFLLIAVYLFVLAPKPILEAVHLVSHFFELKQSKSFHFHSHTTYSEHQHTHHQNNQNNHNKHTHDHEHKIIHMVDEKIAKVNNNTSEDNKKKSAGIQEIKIDQIRDNATINLKNTYSIKVNYFGVKQNILNEFIIVLTPPPNYYI